ncbi:MAG: OB-fold domain-containing protein [bacterium]|nr:OB-fold domain-containing protein [bacterium]
MDGRCAGLNDVVMVSGVEKMLDVDGGVRITTQVTDVPADQIQIGMRVRVEFRKIADDGPEGIHLFGCKVVPE